MSLLLKEKVRLEVLWQGRHSRGCKPVGRLEEALTDVGLRRSRDSGGSIATVEVELAIRGSTCVLYESRIRIIVRRRCQYVVVLAGWLYKKRA